MHMWFWWGYDLGDFLFHGVAVSSRTAFAVTWILLFVFAVLFEGSKVYLARVQREAQKRLYPYRSDERRTLLCDREHGSLTEASTSRNESSGHVSRWDTVRVRMLVNVYQSLVFVVHNVAGYLLMLAVMLYNFYLLLAVVLGMTIGYFLFGTKLTLLQMQCFRTRRVVICTPECDDTAEGTTPPLLNSNPSSESDFFVCRTRSCVQPSHYFPANTSQDGGETSNATCYFGAKMCPSKVARAQRMQASCESEKEDSPSVEDVLLLRSERQGCCKKKQTEMPPEPSQNKAEGSGCCKKEPEPEVSVPDDSPKISCCAHNASKTTHSDSQEHIVE